MASLVALAVAPCATDAWEGPLPRLPVGMNIGGAAYWAPAPYLDPLLTSGAWIAFHEGGPWDDGSAEQLATSPEGWPLGIPQSVGGVRTMARTMLNNCREGTYEVAYQGAGRLRWEGGASASEVGGKLLVKMSGDCGHAWMTVDSSDPTDPVRAMRMTAVEYASAPGGAPLFDPDFVRGLRPFHALRFMDWTSTNGSRQVRWSDRPKPGDRTFGAGNGMPWEHAIALSELLGADAWICTPHAADDDYLRRLAVLFRDSLDRNLKVYLEYSNEIWNWGFDQAHWVGRNGADVPWGSTTEEFLAADSLRDSLRAVGSKVCGDPESYCHPEKDAWMMGRLFRIWEPVWSGQRARLVTVATGQYAWMDNSRRILDWLVDVMGIRPDAFSVAGYVGFADADHERWMLRPDTVEAADVARAMLDSFPANSMAWTLESARIVRSKGISRYLVYEGGQHAQPYQQSDWPYNEAVWGAQIHPLMREVYLRNLQVHDSIGCDLFMAFSYVGERKSKYGSWGHLETYAQSALGLEELRTVAPKYAALLEANEPRANTSVGGRRAVPAPLGTRRCAVVGGRLVGAAGPVEIRSPQGRLLHRGDAASTPRLADGLVLVRPSAGTP